MPRGGRTASGLIENEAYWRWYEERAKALGSDGCSKVSEWNRRCCYRHDVHCRTQQDIHGNYVSREDADARFWECNRIRSPFSWLSPRSWVRWAGVRIGAKMKRKRHVKSESTGE
jgi:hypothetical protein